ncbi:MAG: hypothetical protein MJY97_01185 [Bacteroidales bacterium]|nr:hypothetical protein [Bacteroidales bacterium]
MEKITFHLQTSNKKTVKVRYRLRAGRGVQICHKSDIVANLADLEKFLPNGDTKGRVSVYNLELSQMLKKEYEIMMNAYSVMKDTGLDITTPVFEREILRIKNPIEQIRNDNPTIIARFRQYANDALRHGIIGAKRHKHIIVVSDKLERFLVINGISSITSSEFSERHLMDFRDFLFDEYLYIYKYPSLYSHVKQQNKPKTRLSMNTVVSQMKMFKTFFAELEDSEEIHKSPFSKIGRERRVSIMKTRYDDPIFLRREELMIILDTVVPERLKNTKDAFLVQCALGCRISDFQAMNMDSISVSGEGIPYVHYVPSKTASTQHGNEEVKTPIVRFAFDIIQHNGFEFPIIKNVYGHSGYNPMIKALLEFCGINRMVPLFNEETKSNDYVPLYQEGSSKLCRKTHVDMMNKVQIDMYAAGLHREGSSAVTRYTQLEIKDRFELFNLAFDQVSYTVDQQLNII